MTQTLFDETYFAENYRDYAAQNPPRKLAFYTSLVEQYRVTGVPRRIHDIGCGLGMFLSAMNERWELSGSDISSFAVGEASKNCPRGRFEVASVTDPPESFTNFGTVTAFDVIEHVPDLDTVVEAIDRQLVPGGTFLFVVPVYDGLSGPIIRLLDHDITHVHRWPRSRWLKWAAAHFEVIAWKGILRYLLPFRYYVHWTTRLLRSHTPAICVVCRKTADGEQRPG